jgi:hypothetical protein
VTGKKAANSDLLEWLLATTENGSEWRLATGEWLNGSDERLSAATGKLATRLLATTENGSEWRIASSEWSSDSDVGVAISHDRNGSE